MPLPSRLPVPPSSTRQHRVFVALTLALSLVPLVHASAAHAQTSSASACGASCEALVDVAAADSYWTARDGHAGPCSGRYTVRFAPLPGRQAQADGIAPWPSRQDAQRGPNPEAGSYPYAARPGWQLTGCAVTYDPTQWAGMTPKGRCITLHHEIGHYYGHDHEEGGVMVAGSGQELADFAPCDFQPTFRQTIIATLSASYGPGIQCGKWDGRVLPCRNRITHARYRVRTRGFLFAIARVKAPRSHAKTNRKAT